MLKMCFPRRKLKKKQKKYYNKPNNQLTGCKMIILIDEPQCKFYRPEYCNRKVSENGLCKTHKDLCFMH